MYKRQAITPEGRTVVLLNEPGHFGLKKMIDAAKRTRKDSGVFELSWENSNVVVRANLKIVGTTQAAPAAAPPPGSAAGFRRMRLPEIITAPAPVAAPAAAASPAAAAPAAAPAAPRSQP